jgi:hypothetical protein
VNIYHAHSGGCEAVRIERDDGVIEQMNISKPMLAEGRTENLRLADDVDR